MSTLERLKAAGVPFIETEKLNDKLIEPVLCGFVSVLDDMQVPVSKLYSVSGRDTIRGHGVIAVNGLGELLFKNKAFCSRYEICRLDAETDARLFGIGAHEAGHFLITVLIARSMGDRSQIEQARTWHEHKFETLITREAMISFGGNPTISSYGSTGVAEKVAEAVADVYSGRTISNPYSQVIVNLLRYHLDNPRRDFGI